MSTGLLDAPSTATGPTAVTVARRLRWPVLVLLALVLVSGFAALAGRTSATRLDPRGYGPAGTRALAQLLQDRGTDVRVVGTIEQATDGDSARTTVLVPFGTGLAAAEYEALADLPGSLIVVEATEQALTALAVPVEAKDQVATDTTRPACSLPAAERAGTVALGGRTYRATGSDRAIGCYATDGDSPLLQLPGRRITLLGSADFLTNRELAEDGAAALALGLLAPADEVRWLLPPPGREVAGDRPGVTELLPRWIAPAIAQLAIAALVLALWRARRLGRVVEEPLPIVVRAAEAVEGRSRLYRAAGARGRAGEALRAAARETVVRRVRLGSTAGRTEVVTAAAGRTGQDPAEVDALLYGPPPTDDAGLVRLADRLDALTHAVNREVAGS